MVFIHDGPEALRVGIVAASGIDVTRASTEIDERIENVLSERAHDLDEAAALGRVSGERFAGGWADVGTPERLRELEARLAQSRDIGRPPASTG